MDRKKFIAVAISAALGLSGAPVYASESAAFSDGEVQEYGAEEEKQEFQTDSQDPQGKRMRMDLHINILKNLIHTA